jgi:hypothetical protein
MGPRHQAFAFIGAGPFTAYGQIRYSPARARRIDGRLQLRPATAAALMRRIDEEREDRAFAPAALPRSERARLETGPLHPLPNGLLDDVNDFTA